MKPTERWLELCELAAKERDPEKLTKLVEEINSLLDAKLSWQAGRVRDTEECETQQQPRKANQPTTGQGPEEQ